MEKRKADNNFPRKHRYSDFDKFKDHLDNDAVLTKLHMLQEHNTKIKMFPWSQYFIFSIHP